MVGHVTAQGMVDAYSALKVGGFFVSAMRKMYWVDGHACGYKDMIDDLVEQGKFQITKTFNFKRGIPGGDSLYAEMESVLFVCQKVQ